MVQPGADWCYCPAIRLFSKFLLALNDVWILAAAAELSACLARRLGATFGNGGGYMNQGIEDIALLLSYSRVLVRDHFARMSVLYVCG